MVPNSRHGHKRSAALGLAVRLGASWHAFCSGRCCCCTTLPAASAKLVRNPVRRHALSRDTRGGIAVDVSRVYQYAVKAVPTLPRALIGPGAAELAGVEAAGMGLKHVLFVTTGLRGTGIIDEMKSI